MKSILEAEGSWWTFWCSKITVTLITNCASVTSKKMFDVFDFRILANFVFKSLKFLQLRANDFWFSNWSRLLKLWERLPHLPSACHYSVSKKLSVYTNSLVWTRNIRENKLTWIYCKVFLFFFLFYFLSSFYHQAIYYVMGNINHFYSFYSVPLSTAIFRA